MFLVERALKGLAPPTTLPSELLPAKVSPVSASPGTIMKSSLEDRKKENFDKGKAELERRRKLLMDEENKVKVNG